MNDKKTTKKVVALGKFDGMHVGHLKLLDATVSAASESGAVPVVYFIGRPSSFLTDEKTILDIAVQKGIECFERQELTTEFKSMSAEEFVSDILRDKLNASHVVAGYNFRFARNRSADVTELRRLCNLCGMECTIIDEVRVCDGTECKTVSSSLIRELVNNGELDKIQLYLGRPYTMSGIVVHGKHLGSELDFPTANIIPEKGMALLPAGVYVTVTEIEGQGHISVTNIGNNPTVGGDIITVETHIPGFCGDLYGKNITLRFCRKIRGEKKFASVDELKAQMASDTDYAQSLKNKYIG